MTPEEKGQHGLLDRLLGDSPSHPGHGRRVEPCHSLTMLWLSAAGYRDRSPWELPVLALSTNSAPLPCPLSPPPTLPSLSLHSLPRSPLPHSRPHLSPCLCPQRLRPSRLEGSTCPWRYLPTGATAHPWSWPTIKPTSQPWCPWNRETNRENKVCPVPETEWDKAMWGVGRRRRGVCGQPPRGHELQGPAMVSAWSCSVGIQMC